MKEKDIKDILKSKFQLVEDKYFPDQWKTVLSLFFKKINYFSHPENLFTENDKVIDGKQIGTVKLDDGKQLAIFTVEVADSISIIRNRQGLREIAAKHIDQNIIHGSLAFFYNKKQADYRFSFIAKEASIDLETGELIKGETKPKRYTYLLGSNEACTTPAKRMLVLADKKEKGAVDINQLKEVFSVEALNKDFFKTYKAHYEKFWKYLADEENSYRTKLIDAEKDDKVKQEKPIRDFAKKLLGRIVFLHFLQKKGWMGCSPKTKDWIDGEPRFMQQLFEDFSKPEHFQSQCLTHLFFETLNTRRPNDTFEVKGLNGKLNGSRVPYLNGGLFEPEKNKATLKIDFPADYFKELLEFFEQYNFTIDENSPDDHEVGIDPEMLGHIFENLLEDNRDKGAFYTPKEIVQYMCKESLIQYLKNSPPLQAGASNSPPLEGCPSGGVVKRAAKNYFDLPYNPDLKQRAKELRQAGNLSEVLFWNQVKNKQFKGYDFDRQKIVGNYIVDFFCTNCNVVIEIDGSSHDDKQEYDAEREAFLQSLGLTIIHIPVNDLMKNITGVMEMLFDHPALSDISLASKNHPALSGTPPKEGNWDTAIEAFIRFHTVSPLLAEKENAVLLNKKLDDIKVCDPAIGSGAFPIGMLQEIFEAKRFIYPYLKTNKDFKPAEVKKNIIQNSIYGVDLEKGAVDIAQLRFWLSLVVDELNPHPLPNLDYKIMQGNSLLEHFEGIELGKVALFEEPKVRIIEPTLFEEPKANYGFSKENRTNIKELIADYFKVEEKAQKTSIHKQIDSIVTDHIDKSLEFFENKLLIEIATYEKQLESKTSNLSQAQKGQYLQKSKEVKEIEKRQAQLQSKTAARKRLLEFENTDERPYFLWHLYFMDVFEKGGFDVMIGNPPYIQLQKMGKETDILQDAGFETFARTGDIYCLFYEKGIDLLKKNNGVLSYITSNSWMKTKYGEPLRKFFIEKTNPIKLLNFEDTQIFPSATVEVNILISKKQAYSKETESVALLQDSVNKSIQSYFEENKIVLDSLNNSEWIILSKSDYQIKLKIEGSNKTIGDLDYNINIGINTGLNEVFIISEELKNEFITQDGKNKEILVPTLKGRNLKKYGFSFDNNYLVNAHNGLKKHNIPPVNIEKDYPVIFNYFLNHKDKLLARWDQGTNWYNLRNCAYLDDFEKDKLIWGELSDRAKFSFDTKKYMLDATVFLMTGENLKSLYCILNSSVGNWYFNIISTTSGMGTNRWKKYKIQKFPIPELNKLINKPFETLAEYLIYLNDPKQAPVLEKVSNEALSQVFEDLVNMIVYELYFEEEMKAKEIDVLQFVTSNPFPDVTQAEDKKAVIQKVYYELQQKDNAIRNRILVASSRSETIARINAATS